MKCFYCGGDHATHGCPTLQIARRGGDIKKTLETHAHSIEESLRQLGREAEVNLSAIAQNVAALGGILRVGFARVLQELQGISDILKHPVTIQAANDYEIGMTMLQRGQLDDAERKLCSAREADPSAYAPYVGLASVYIESGREAEAEKYLELATRNAANDAQLAYALLLFGRFLTAQERFDEARTKLQEAARRKPRWALVWYVLAQCTGKAGNWSDCSSALRKAINLDPLNYQRAQVDPFFDPVRANVQKFLRELATEVYNQIVATINSLKEQLTAIESEGLAEFAAGDYRRVLSTLQVVENSLSIQNYVGLIEGSNKCSEISKDVEALRRTARNNFDKAVESWEERRRKAGRRWWWSLFLLGWFIIGPLAAAVIFSIFHIDPKDSFSNAILLFLMVGLSALLGLLGFLIGRWRCGPRPRLRETISSEARRQISVTDDS